MRIYSGFPVYIRPVKDRYCADGSGKSSRGANLGESKLLTGSYFNTVDNKGRAFVPTKLRYDLSERIWLVKGFDSCIYLMSQEAWKDFIETYITDLSLKDSNARRLQRFIFGNSKELDIDSHGRINIPQDHLEYAGIDKDIVFVGAGDRVELWSKERYEADTDPDVLDPDLLIREAENTRQTETE